MSFRIETYDNEGNIISVEDNRDLAAEKQRLVDDINSYRMEVMNNSGFWFMGHRWDSDEVARTNITGAVTSLAVGLTLPSNFTWRDHDNNDVPMNAASMVGLGGYAMKWVNTVYGVSWYLKAIVNGFTTLDEIDAFSVTDPSHWPDNDMDGSKPT